MKKRLIAMAVAGAVAAPLAAQADDVSVDGFAEITYTITNDDTPTLEKAFGANGEVDVSASPAEGVTARLDLDVNLAMNNAPDASGGDSARIEQAFFAWGVTEQVTLVGGVFNNPIGQDEEDVPDINFITHSAVFNILDNQTALYGNNIAGVAIAGGTDMFTGTLAYLNDIGGVPEENSIAVVINVNPMQDVALEFGYVTQDNDGGATPILAGNGGGAGNVWDINGSWSNIAGSGAEVGFDYLAASEVVDAAWNVWAGFGFGNGFVIRGRYETVALDAGPADDPSAFSLYGAWEPASNLQIALEYRDGDSDGTADAATGITDGKLVGVQFIAGLP